MVAKPLVSVIINTYNRAALVIEAIESVRAQTYSNFELIVADDGSPDDTAERVAAYGREVRFLPLPHSGQSKACRNAAMAVAQGELIAFMDDDDRWREDKLACQVAAFTADPGLGLVFSDLQFLLPDGSLSPAVLPAEQRHDHAIFERLLADCFIHPSTAMFHRRMLERFGPLSERFDYQADYHYWLQMTQVARAHCVPEPLVFVRRHPHSLSGGQAIRHYSAAVEVLEEVQKSFALTRPQRLILRRTLARWHAHLGLLLRDNEPAGARQHFLRSLACYPLQKRAWLALVGV
jgi:glycosyltransferase involved in cell wall biosynthesis